MNASALHWKNKFVEVFTLKFSLMFPSRFAKSISDSTACFFLKCLCMLVGTRPICVGRWLVGWSASPLPFGPLLSLSLKSLLLLLLLLLGSPLLLFLLFVLLRSPDLFLNCIKQKIRLIYNFINMVILLNVNFSHNPLWLNCKFKNFHSALLNLCYSKCQ